MICRAGFWLLLRSDATFFALETFPRNPASAVRPHAMATEQDPENVLVLHLDYLQEIVRATCRRQGFGRDEADDCMSWVHVKLVENDYARLREFRGESQVRTYLTMVVVHLVRDFRIQQWGKWRPSAVAKRLGESATRLETLVYRDGHSLDQAIEIMRSGTPTADSDRQLRALYRRLPPRGPLRPRRVPAEHMDGSVEAPGPDAEVARAERDDETERVGELIQGAIAQLPPNDGAVIRLAYLEGLSVAEVARGLNVPQKPLYRHLERVKRRLRSLLEDAGLTSERVKALLQEAIP